MRFLAPLLICGVAQAAEAPFSVEAPGVALREVPFSLKIGAVAGRTLPAEIEWSVLGNTGRIQTSADTTSYTIEGLELDGSGATKIDLVAGGHTFDLETRVLSPFLSLLPALAAIILAIALREVLLALFVGVWIGAMIAMGEGPFGGLLRALDTYMREAVADSDHTAIILFSILLGGMVGVIAKSGGALGIAEAVTKFAKNRKRGQLTTWLLGIAIFFDDYSNSLLVGTTMRPVTDKLKISREKLSYLVDSTAAPISCIALISTWVGVEISYIGTEFAALGITRNPYETFVSSIPYSFYPILTLFLGFLVAWTGRDFGPMLAAERRAVKGKVIRDGAIPISDFDDASFHPPEHATPRWWYAAAPIAVVVTVMIGGMYMTGREGAERGVLDATGFGDLIGILRSIYGGADAYPPLMWASLLGGIVAIGIALGTRTLNVRDSMAAHMAGCKSMLMALAILALAWSLGRVCKDLHAADYLVSILGGEMNPGWLPAMIFLIAAGTSFATGTSWGTMGILFPLAIPVAHQLAPGQEHIMLGAIASILAGSVFGDHCSPISDTTVLSSMASSADHIDHVRTQLPYALVPASVALLVGSVASGFGWFGPALGLPIGCVLLIAFVRLVGKPVVE